MQINPYDAWADLRHAVDVLDRPPANIYKSLMSKAKPEDQPYDEFTRRLYQVGALCISYSRAESRAKSVLAHEAMERGLKGLLRAGGFSTSSTFGHDVQPLATQLEKHHQGAFEHLQCCFDSGLKFCEESYGTIVTHKVILDYFEENFNRATYDANRYWTIESGEPIGAGIPIVNLEILRALASITIETKPKDVYARIEEGARGAILSARTLDSAWDALEWLERGSVRQRLESVENLERHKVLRAALRICDEQSEDSAVRRWARRLRVKRIKVRKSADWLDSYWHRRHKLPRTGDKPAT